MGNLFTNEHEYRHEINRLFDEFGTPGITSQSRNQTYFAGCHWTQMDPHLNQPVSQLSPFGVAVVVAVAVVQQVELSVSQFEWSAKNGREIFTRKIPSFYGSQFADSSAA